MKQKNFTLSIKTLYIMLILVFANIIALQFYFLKNAEKKIKRELLLTHTGRHLNIIPSSAIKKLPPEKRMELEKKGATLYKGFLYIKRNGKIAGMRLKDTMIYKVGKDLLFLNIIFDLLLIWIALYFYFKIFVDISKANTTIELSANGKFVPEKLPDVEVEGVDRIIENFRTIYLNFLKTEKEIKRKSQFESLGLVSAKIIHDLKNSLAYILVMIYKAKTLESRSEVNDILNAINIKIDELRIVLEDVLGALKGGKELKVENVDIEVIKNGFEKEFTLLSKNLGIDFKVSFDNDLIGKEIAVNPFHFKSAIENLIHNSIKILEKSVQREKKMGLDFIKKDKNIEIIVWDNGDGIKEEIKSNIFDTFVSGDGKGVGLGLSTVKEFVESNGGNIRIESGKEGLTRFILTLPFAGRKHGGK